MGDGKWNGGGLFFCPLTKLSNSHLDTLSCYGRPWGIDVIDSKCRVRCCCRVRARTPPSNVSSDGREKKVGRTPPLLYLLASTQYLMTSSDSSSSSFSFFFHVFTFILDSSPRHRHKSNLVPDSFPATRQSIVIIPRSKQAEKLSLVFFLLLWSSSSISFPLSSPSQISISKKKDKLRIYLWGKRRSFLLKVRFILSLSLARSLLYVVALKKEGEEEEERKENKFPRALWFIVIHGRYLVPSSPRSAARANVITSPTVSPFSSSSFVLFWRKPSRREQRRRRRRTEE